MFDMTWRSQTLQNRNQKTALPPTSLCAAILALLLTGTASLAHGARVTGLYDFGTVDATQTAPGGDLVEGSNGRIYGEMNFNRSEIYEMTPGGRETLLWTSPQPPAGADVCYTGMTLGTDGLLYGTCEEWDNNDTSSGVIFQFNPGKKQHGLKVIYTFPAFGNGGYEYPSALTLGTDGNFYGTTRGDTTNPYGTVFKVTPQGVYTTLHVFQGASQNDGADPSYTTRPVPLTLGSDGNFYGTTDAGGLNGQQNGGTVYQITPTGTVTILYYFPNGISPLAGVTELNNNFYGQTYRGGPSNDGTIYQLTPGGVLTTLHNFNQMTDSAAVPNFLLTPGTDGNFYDASSDYADGGYGPESLYKITPSGTYTDLYNGFAYQNDCSPAPDACYVNSPLLLHTNGRFYGVTGQGGTAGRGVFYDMIYRQAPFARLQLSAGKPGTWIGILGQGFSRTTTVSFNGVPARFDVVSDTFVRAQVPTDAGKGRVQIAGPAEELSTNTEFTPLH